MNHRSLLVGIPFITLALFSAGCPDKQKDGGAAAPAAAEPAAPAASTNAATDKPKEDEPAKPEKKDQGGW